MLPSESSGFDGSAIGALVIDPSADTSSKQGHDSEDVQAKVFPWDPFSRATTSPR